MRFVRPRSGRISRILQDLSKGDLAYLDNSGPPRNPPS